MKIPYVIMIFSLKIKKKTEKKIAIFYNINFLTSEIRDL